MYDRVIRSTQTHTHIPTVASIGAPSKFVLRSSRSGHPLLKSYNFTNNWNINTIFAQDRNLTFRLSGYDKISSVFFMKLIKINWVNFHKLVDPSTGI